MSGRRKVVVAILWSVAGGIVVSCLALQYVGTPRFRPRTTRGQPMRANKDSDFSTKLFNLHVAAASIDDAVLKSTGSGAVFGCLAAVAVASMFSLLAPEPAKLESFKSNPVVVVNVNEPSAVTLADADSTSEQAVEASTQPELIRGVADVGEMQDDGAPGFDFSTLAAATCAGALAAGAVAVWKGSGLEMPTLDSLSPLSRTDAVKELDTDSAARPLESSTQQSGATVATALKQTWTESQKLSAPLPVSSFALSAKQSAESQINRSIGAQTRSEIRHEISAAKSSLNNIVKSLREQRDVTADFFTELGVAPRGPMILDTLDDNCMSAEQRRSSKIGQPGAVDFIGARRDEVLESFEMTRLSLQQQPAKPSSVIFPASSLAEAEQTRKLKSGDMTEAVDRIIGRICARVKA